MKVFKIHEHLRAKVRVGCKSFIIISLRIIFDLRIRPILFNFVISSVGSASVVSSLMR